MGTIQLGRGLGLVTWRARTLDKEDHSYPPPVGCATWAHCKNGHTLHIGSIPPSAMGLCNPLHQEVESISPALETAGHETCSGQWETGRCDASGGMKLGHWGVLSRCSRGPSGPGGKGPGQPTAWRTWPSCVIAAGPRPPSPR